MAPEEKLKSVKNKCRVLWANHFSSAINNTMDDGDPNRAKKAAEAAKEYAEGMFFKWCLDRHLEVTEYKDAELDQMIENILVGHTPEYDAVRDHHLEIKKDLASDARKRKLRKAIRTIRELGYELEITPIKEEEE